VADLRPTRVVPPLDGVRPAADIEPLLDTAGVARLCGVCRRSVERMIARRQLPPPDLVVCRRLKRWRPDTIRRWLEEGGRP